MKKVMLKLVVAGLILVISGYSVSAEVYTKPHTEGMADCVYIAGEPDLYPVEYYNKETKQYEGVIPELLEKISQNTGVDFAYINGGKQNKDKLGKNLQVEVVSSATENEEGEHKKDFVPLIISESNSETVKIGLMFTSVADDKIIETIKAEAQKITPYEVNGLVIKNSSGNDKSPFWFNLTIVICCVLFAAVSILLALEVKRTKQKNRIERMTDAQTGMGNLMYFKHHFENTITDFSRNLYYVAYIILDSSYLRSYYGDTSFEDALGHTASTLLGYTADNEIAARITENGFAFAYQSVNEDEAKKRIEEVIGKLNRFLDEKERNNKFVFHAATYNLLPNDRDCEIILFNLRKNCNKIFGTEKQIVFCDVHSMNRVQEEKKIAESIINGFKDNEFKLYIQFIVDNKTKRIVSGEGLSRWDNSEKGLLGPGKYIETMESAGLISMHDLYMFEKVCAQLEKWENTPLSHISLSCNFTRITISERDFVSNLKAVSDRFSFDRSKLVIEITEDAIEKNIDNAMQNVTLIKELGFRIALDDLGSGYTSLSNLCDYPIDVVKIDRDILVKTNTERGRDLFHGIIALAHSLGLKVVCEGVETIEQNQLVSGTECDYIQGWFYSKAIPAEECDDFEKQYSEKIQ